jgi:undecaprenol kinase
MRQHQRRHIIVQDMQSKGEFVRQIFAPGYYPGKFTIRVPPEVHRKFRILEESIMLCSGGFGGAGVSMNITEQLEMKSFIKSAGYAINGLSSAFKTERNLRIHCGVVIAVIALGFYLRISSLAWGLVILAMGFVLVAELMNTAIERLGDQAANGRQKELIKKSKDIAAGGVLMAALTALAIGVIFLVVPLIERLA